MINVRKSVQNMKPYFVNESKCTIKLDANEGGNYLLEDKIIIDKLSANLYPDSDASKLRKILSKYYGCRPENMIMGNGSSELIQMVISTYCEYGEKAMTFSPCFGMYDIYCKLCQVDLIKIEAQNGYKQNLDSMIQIAKETKPKMIILCNPNNPSGYLNKKEDVLKMVVELKDILIVVDEAYTEFCKESVVSEIEKYENLVVLRTLSKAFGLANIRVGCALAKEEIIKNIWKVKPPYNLNGPSQILAITALENIQKTKSYIEKIIIQREELYRAFTSKKAKSLDIKAYPSGANFIYVESKKINLYENFIKRGILIKTFGGELKNFYRITVGNSEENKKVIETFMEMENYV